MIGNWFYTWHFALPEDGTLVAIHVTDMSLIFICI